MRVGNIHAPQAGADGTKMPTEGQTQTLRRTGDAISFLRFRNVDDDGRDEEATPDNATTDDEDDHPGWEKIKTMSAVAHAVNVDEVADDEPHNPDCNLEEDTTETNPQDPQRARRKQPRR